MISHDLHVIVTIGPGMFVPEPDHMAKLVHDDTELVAIFSNGYRLWTVAAFAHERTASGKKKPHVDDLVRENIPASRTCSGITG